MLRSTSMVGGLVRNGTAKGLALGVFAGLMATTAYGQTVWTGASDPAWTNALNWDNGVSTDSDVAIIKPASGDTEPVLDGEVASSSALFIGSVDGANLAIRGGGQLTTGSAIIGNSSVNNAPANQLPSELATVTLSGAGSSLSANFLDLGFYGSGILNVSDGASLNTTYFSGLGTHADSRGELILTDEGTTASLDGGVMVGGNGNGLMGVYEGADVTSGAVTIGDGAVSSSTLEISGTGSTWEMASGSLVIGNLGEGTLSISDGGDLDTSNRVFVGNSAGSTGHLDITGAGSRLNAADYVALGFQGNGHGTVTDGSVLQGSEVLVSWDEDSVSDLRVAGVGSQVNVGNYLMVGYNGEAVATIADGASVNALATGTTASVRLAYGSTSTATLNIGAARGDGPAAAGFINVGILAFGDGDGELVFNHSNIGYQFTAAIQNNGTISHLAGDTFLAADSSSFTGMTNVDGGTLKIGEALGGLVNVRNGGTFGGSGVLNSLNVASGGSVAPDGTLSVLGNASFDTGSFYLVDADVNGVDLLDVAGTLDLVGGTVMHQESAATFEPFSRYVIASADGGVLGEFDAVQSELAFMNPELSYTANEVWLDLLRNDVDLTDIALSYNQQSVGTALSGLPMDDPLVRSILMMSAGSARLSYDQLAGEIHGSSASVFIKDTGIFRNLMSERTRSYGSSTGGETVNRNRMSFASYDETPSSGVWMQGIGARSEFDGDGNANATRRTLSGFALGYDTQIGNELTAGIMAGTLNTSISNAIGAETDADSLTLGAYLGTTGSRLQFSGGALVSWHDVDSVRSLAALGQGPALGGYDARTYSIYAEASYKTQFNGYKVEPFVSLAHVGYESDGFTEAGGIGGLTVDPMSTETTFGTIGIRGEVALGNEVSGGNHIVATGMLGWSHAFGDTNPGVSAGLQGNALTAYGMPISRNELFIEAGLDMWLSESSTFNVSYSGRLADSYSDHGLKAALQVVF